MLSCRSRVKAKNRIVYTDLGLQQVFTILDLVTAATMAESQNIERGNCGNLRHDQLIAPRP
jgi:hypothetical protein